MKIPFLITTDKVEILGKTIIGFAFFLWIVVHPRITGKKREEIILHEKIHFHQQMELLFVFHWILYSFFYLRGRINGLDHKQAYRNNPFELEAYQHDQNEDYLDKRKKYNWLKLI